MIENLNRLFVRLTHDESGQDMVEYALMAAFVAVAAGAILPPVANDVSKIFSKMGSVIADARS